LPIRSSPKAVQYKHMGYKKIPPRLSKLEAYAKRESRIVGGEKRMVRPSKNGKHRKRMVRKTGGGTG